jgi:hypothetical protein
MHHNTRTPHERQTQRGSSSPEYYAYHDPTSPAKLSTTLAHALADVMRSDITDAGIAISNCVAPDALDRLFSQSDGGHATTQGHIAFSATGYRVTVYSSGHIVITPPGNSAGYGGRTDR